MPRMQLALDMVSLSQAIEVANQVKDQFQVIEAGTILCAAQGVRAVQALRNAFPKKIIQADIRIVRAGSSLAEMMFEAGADEVTCVAEAPEVTLKAVAAVAESKGGKVQLELDPTWDSRFAVDWIEMGITDVICHHTHEVTDDDDSYWGETAYNHIQAAASQGLSVSVAGGIGPDSAGLISGLSVDTVICGRSIWQHADPVAAAKEIIDIFK